MSSSHRQRDDHRHASFQPRERSEFLSPSKSFQSTCSNTRRSSVPGHGRSRFSMFTRDSRESPRISISSFSVPDQCNSVENCRRSSENLSDFSIGVYRGMQRSPHSASNADASLSEYNSANITSMPSFFEKIQPRTSSGLIKMQAVAFASLFRALSSHRATSRSSSFGTPRDERLPSTPRQDSPSPGRLPSLYRSSFERGYISSLSPSPINPSKARNLKNDSVDSVQNGVCGIRNSGNSCYQNAVIQLLNAIPEFSRALLHNRSRLRSDRVAKELGNLLDVMSVKNERECVDTSSLRSRLARLDSKWAGYGQEDAHEFLTQLVSALQEDCNRNASKPDYREVKDCDDVRLQADEEWKYSKQWNDSAIDDILGFQLHNQITCPDCLRVSHRFGYLTSLEIPLSDKATTLQECLRVFSNVESLDEENAWECPQCKSPVQALQQLRLSRLPRVLLVCLKRFGATNSRFTSFRSWKNTTAIDVPQDPIHLSSILSPFADIITTENAEYELIAIVDHSGSVHFGHYTARVKNADRSTWYLMNDEIVHAIPQPCGPSESAYILALRQRLPS